MMVKINSLYIEGDQETMEAVLKITKDNLGVGVNVIEINHKCVLSEVSE